MATITNLVKGDTVTFECEALENITGWKIRVEIYGSAHSIKKATANTGGSDSQVKIIDAINGEFEIYINKGETTDFEHNAKIEIEMEDVSGKLWTVHQEDVEFSSERIKWITP